MRFYTQQHQHYCGVDLHARTMYVCVLDQAGEVQLHKDLPTSRSRFLQAMAPYREDLAVAAECMFAWYWLADLCAEQGIAFVLGHALYMRAIHGGKAKNDRLDSKKIAALLRGGTLPQAYVYPPEMRSTRDLLRRREHFVHKRSELLAHIENSKTQHNLPPFDKRISKSRDYGGAIEHFDDDAVQMSIAADAALIKAYDEVIRELELYLLAETRENQGPAFHLLRTIPGVGEILAQTILYEVHDISRFEKVGNFLSYARLVRCSHESAGKKRGSGGKKIGNAHLKWAYSEAAASFLRTNPRGQKLLGRLEKKHGKGKALSILAAKLARASYFMLKRNEPFDRRRFYAS